MRLATLTLNDPSSTRHWLIWLDLSATNIVSTVQKPINRHVRLSMIQGDAAMQVCGGTDYADPNLGLKLGHLNNPLSTRHWLIKADFYANRTISTIQKPINAHERLSMIQGDAAVLVCEGTGHKVRG